VPLQPMSLKLAALTFGCCCLGGCFLGYDSRWGQAARSQKAAAAEAKPAQLQATPGQAPTHAVSVQQIRAYVTRDYAAQVTDERKRIERIIEDANEVLGPTLALRLELDELRRWEESPKDLDEALATLEAIDAAEDVGWVVGLVGRLPTLRSRFTELGNARMNGHHFVMRAMNDAAEFDSIAERFDELDEKERRSIYRRRVEHEEVAVFLHELAHTLGVPHASSAATTLMSPQYDRDAASFSEAAVAVMRRALQQRLAPQVANGPEGFDAERWGDLSDAERKAYLEAVQLEEGERHDEAWRRAEPLFAAHPDHYEVQDLRCRLAMKRGGEPDALERHCAAFRELEGVGAKLPSPW